MPPAPYPLSALRAVALHTQGLTTSNDAEIDRTPDAIADLVERLLYIQIDTLQMVQRSHYLALWSRLGAYDVGNLDRLIYVAGERRLFEYWGHAASVIPLSDYALYIPAMRRRCDGPSRWWGQWLEDPKNRETVDRVLARIAEEGPLRAADFAYDGPQRGSWWDWKPAKRALERLFACGDLMVADRVNFQRVYDLSDRVRPDWVDASEPPSSEATLKVRVERSLRALGVCEPAQVAEYAYLKRGTANPIVKSLIDEGIAVEITGILLDGEPETLIIHRDDLPLLERAAAGDISPSRTTFLSPFDNLFWARGRDEAFWGFQQILEAYKPAKDRIWGYFCLPILHRGRLVGRFDPKLERSDGVLRLKQLYLEPGVEPDGDLVAGVAAAMRDFLTFHAATGVEVERSDPPEFGERLLAAL
jgi:uncharacterized protein YcaQ